MLDDLEGAGPRKSDAERLVTELVKRRNDGDYWAPEKITVGTYLTEKWLPVQRSQLKASTFDSYRRTIELHVLPTIAGMRRGEVLGLRWTDVDVPRKRLSVRQAITAVAYQLRISDVKTGTARRTIDIDDPVVAQLTAWRKRQAEERLLVGPAYEDHGLVFARPDGRPVHPEFLSRRFDRIVRTADLPVIRFHDVTHTHASLLLKAGVPVKVVSERLGHASPGFTLNVYHHVIPGMQAEAAAAFSRLLSEDLG